MENRLALRPNFEQENVSQSNRHCRVTRLALFFVSEKGAYGLHMTWWLPADTRAA